MLLQNSVDFDIFEGKDSFVLLVRVDMLMCQDNTSFVELRHGVLPHVWLRGRDGVQRRCNTSSWEMEMTQHRFLTVLLRSDPSDLTLVFVLDLQYSTVGRKLSITSSHNIEGKHIVHSVIDKWKSLILTITTFAYNGFHMNIQHDQVFQIRPPYLGAITRPGVRQLELEKGKDIIIR